MECKEPRSQVAYIVLLHLAVLSTLRQCLHNSHNPIIIAIWQKEKLRVKELTWLTGEARK